MKPHSSSAGFIPLHERAVAEGAFMAQAPWPMVRVRGARQLVTQVNPAFLRLLGKTEQHLVGKSFQAVVPGQGEFVALLKRVRITGKSESHTHLKRAGPDPVFWSYTAWPVQVEQRAGSVMVQVTETGHFHRQAVAMNEALILSSVRQHELTEEAENLNSRLQVQIAERKQAEAVTHRGKALFASLVAQAPFGVYVVDALLRLQQVNPKGLPLFAHIHPLIGRDFPELVNILWPARVADQVVKRFRHTLKTGKAYRSPDFSERRRDIGVKEVYEWQIQRVILPAGEFGVVCFFSNITERVFAESSQRRLDIMTASNGKLRREIIRRKAGELALKRSEQRAHELLQESHGLEKRLRHISHQMLTVQENQRKEISRELHDKITQLLIGINVHLEIFIREAATNPRGIGRTIAPLRRLVAKSVRTVHRFSRELRPAMLDDLGLIPALRAYLEDFPKRKGRRIEFTAFEGVETLDNDKRTMLYRVAQEALTNVARHAKASVVKVVISKVRGGVRLEIADNGKAFDVKRLSSIRWSRRLGLTGMRERVEMVGGSFTIESIAGTGTTIQAVVPFNAAGVRA
ncbi:MAG: ATP-binding protein [Rariglobus sp.]